MNNANYADYISYDRGGGKVTAVVYDPYLQALKLGTGFTSTEVLLQQDAGTNNLVVAFRGYATDRLVFPSVRGIQLSNGSTRATGIPCWGHGCPLTLTGVADAMHMSLSGSGYGGNVFETTPGYDTVTLGSGANGGSAANLVRYHAGDGALSVLPNGGSVQVWFSDIQEADVSSTTDTAGDLIGTAAGGSDTVTVYGTMAGDSDVQAFSGTER